MTRTPSFSTIASRRGAAAVGDPAPGGPLVWLRGELDVATVTALTGVLTWAVAVDDGDVIVDLSGVEFMDATTIGAMVHARNVLLVQSRRLLVRAPSRCAARLIDLCDLGDLVAGTPIASERVVAAGALGTWVAVPAAERTSLAHRGR